MIGPLFWGGGGGEPSAFLKADDRGGGEGARRVDPSDKLGESQQPFYPAPEPSPPPPLEGRLEGGMNEQCPPSLQPLWPPDAESFPGVRQVNS